MKGLAHKISGEVPMDFSTWTKIALICILGAMSPGPSLAIIIRNTTAGGRNQGMMAATGHGVGVAVYALAAVTGLDLLLKVQPNSLIIINWAGVGFLAWISFQLIRGHPQKGQVKGKNRQPQSSRGFIEGFTVAFLNPKIAAFGAKAIAGNNASPSLEIALPISADKGIKPFK